MRESQPFDLLHCPLDRTNLIEASAGTGKTYALSGLYLRLLLEREWSVAQILVVTFTEAATEELKGRIRDNLRQALDAARGAQVNEPFIQGLMEKYGKRHSKPARAEYLLQRALRCFDEAAISTIHGFCYRILRENAFESGCPFEIEIAPDPSARLETLVQDHWRRKLPSLSKPFVRYLETHNGLVGNLIGLALRYFDRPDAQVVPRVEEPCCDEQEKQLDQAYRSLQEQWASEAEVIGRILLDKQLFNQSKYRQAHVAKWLDQLDHYLAQAELSGEEPGGSAADWSNDGCLPALEPLPKPFQKFTQESVNGGVKKNREPPRHRFFQLCEQFLARRESLLQCYRKAWLALVLDSFDSARAELARQKMDSGARSYSDLLTDVRDALLSPGGEDLARSVQERYRAALIDEFQDTDPVQYAIFQRLFQTDHHTLFLIGDPKQAIYGFRGADVFAYLNASGDVARKFYLEHNWRSDPDLITACNAVFSSHRNPFIYPEIRFQPVRPADQQRDSLCLDGNRVSPLQLWLVRARRFQAKDRLNREEAEGVILPAVAAEIARLIGRGRRGKLRLGAEPLKEKDIAVLVRSNRQAAALQEYLQKLSVPCVLDQTGDLFATGQAMEMQRLLCGILEPARERFVRAALSTSVMGLDALELERLQTDEAAWDGWMERIRDYRDRWHRAGFMSMFKTILNGLQVLPRLMGTAGGERAVTNLLHLAEVLHQEAQQQGLGPAELIQWLAHRRNGPETQKEEHLLRMETDEAAVRIITMHKSKGLEFPVVFCPFCWHGTRRPQQGEPVWSHDPEQDRRLILDLGSEQWQRRAELAVTEDLAESLRLLYVALTRARNRCYLVWGEFTQAETSAPAHLFHDAVPSEGRQDDTGRADPPGPETAAETPQDSTGKPVRDRLLQQLQKITERAKNSIELQDIPPATGDAPPPGPESAGPLSCRAFGGRLDRGWRLASFSSLASGGVRSHDGADRDEVVGEKVPEAEDRTSATGTEADRDIFSFPRGARAGTVLHDIFECLDFRKDPATEGRQVVETTLARYGFDPRWIDPVLDMVRRVLSVPLEPDRPDFTLARIALTDRRSELEFHFPLPTVDAGALNDFLADYLLENGVREASALAGSLAFGAVQGFMKGFIDLVFRFEGRFYLVDWKSNHLGNATSDYDQPGMARVMAEHFYVLQYLIYTLALDRYLSVRLPNYRYETHFGAVFYVFLRGVDPAKGPRYGIYRDRPPRDRLRRLGSLLMAQPKESQA